MYSSDLLSAFELLGTNVTSDKCGKSVEAEGQNSEDKIKYLQDECNSQFGLK